jgi:site-specific DNA recombinase
MPKATAVYCRISKDSAARGLGVARQEKDCRKWAAEHGWPVAEVFTDNDISAYSGKRRPAFERMVEGLKTGQLDAIVVWHPDRLTRSPKELEGIIEVIEATGAAVGTVTAGQYDLTTATGRMTARIVGDVARFERRRNTAVRVQGRPSDHQRVRGRARPGSCPPCARRRVDPGYLAGLGSPRGGDGNRG